MSRPVSGPEYLRASILVNDAAASLRGRVTIRTSACLTLASGLPGPTVTVPRSRRPGYGRFGRFRGRFQVGTGVGTGRSNAIMSVTSDNSQSEPESIYSCANPASLRGLQYFQLGGAKAHTGFEPVPPP